MAMELPDSRPVYVAEGKSMCKIVDAAIVVLSKVHIDSINTLKDKWLSRGLRQALRDQNHPFWDAHGQDIFKDIGLLLQPHLPEGVYFGTHPEIPELVGLFMTGDENNIKHRYRDAALSYLGLPL